MPDPTMEAIQSVVSENGLRPGRFKFPYLVEVGYHAGYRDQNYC